jgi:hypothetical protein
MGVHNRPPNTRASQTQEVTNIATQDTTLRKLLSQIQMIAKSTNHDPAEEELGYPRIQAPCVAPHNL